VFSEDVTIIGNLSVTTDMYDVPGFRWTHRRGKLKLRQFEARILIQSSIAIQGTFFGCSTLCYTDPVIVSVHKSPGVSEENLVNGLHAINNSVNISHFILVGEFNL
jgi:hypothetical protein